MQETKQFNTTGDYESGVKSYEGLINQEYWNIPDTKAEFIIVPEHNEPSTFEEFIASVKLLPFLRSTLNFIEGTHGFQDYNFCIHPRALMLESVSLKQSIWPKTPIMEVAKRIGWYLFIIADKRRSKVQVPDAITSLGMDSPIDYTDAEGKVVKLSLTNRDLCIYENDHTRCFLDAQARPMYIIIMKHYARKQSDLSDQDLMAFWRAGLQVLDTNHHAENKFDVFESMRVNCGGFHNVAHLHLKILIKHSEFEDVWGMNKDYKQLKREMQFKPVKRGLRAVWCCLSPSTD